MFECVRVLFHYVCADSSISNAYVLLLFSIYLEMSFVPLNRISNHFHTGQLSLSPSPFCTAADTQTVVHDISRCLELLHSHNISRINVSR